LTEKNNIEYDYKYDTIQGAVTMIEILKQNDDEEIVYTILDSDNGVIGDY
jgi:hypothetical protein